MGSILFNFYTGPKNSVHLCFPMKRSANFYVGVQTQLFLTVTESTALVINQLWMNCIHKAFQATEKITTTSRYRLALLKKKLRFHSLVACFSIVKGCPVTALIQSIPDLQKLLR